MKKYLFILMLFPFIAYGQSEKAWIQAYPIKDTLFHGYSNVFLFDAPGCASKTYITCSDGGTVAFNGKDYEVRPKMGTRELSVRLWCDSNKEYPVAERKFVVTIMTSDIAKRIKSHQQEKKP